MNMKKSFPDEKGNKFREFLDKKGFYIVLLLCIAVVAGTAVYVGSRRAIDRTAPEYETGDLAEGDADSLLAEEAIADTGEKLTDLDPDEELVSRPGENETDIGSPASVTREDGDADGSAESSKKDTEPKDKDLGRTIRKNSSQYPQSKASSCLSTAISRSNMQWTGLYIPKRLNSGASIRVSISQPTGVLL